jgi:hypothetical protein
MPIVEFDALPDDARVWVFSSTTALPEPSVQTLITEVDAFLSTWKAHGQPLHAARDFRDQRFLAVGVDQSTEGASGCSIDGLFRTLRDLQTRIDGNLLQGGRIFWREADGSITGGTRAEFARAATGETRVFDTTVETAAGWRQAFERAAKETWHAQILKGRREAAAGAGTEP